MSFRIFDRSGRRTQQPAERPGESLHRCVRTLNGAIADVTSDGSVEITTPAAPWNYAVVINCDGGADRSQPPVIGWNVIVYVAVIDGRVGIFCQSAAGAPLTDEVYVTPGGLRRVVLSHGLPGRFEICIRQASEIARPSRVRLNRIIARPRRRCEITGIMATVAPVMLRGPAKPARRAVARALAERGQAVAPDEIGELACETEELDVWIDRVLSDELGVSIWQSTERLLALLPTYKPERPSVYTGTSTSFEPYFRQTAVRVYHLVDSLRRYGRHSGTVLEVGARFGNFAFPLSQLGYRVTALDRYREYGSALSEFKGLMLDSGIAIVETDSTTEIATMKALGQFDIVIAMAVIEHIPHTPRHFLTMLFNRTRPGGLLALDTPNIARYWNRKKMQSGKSIHQDIAYQFQSDVPFPGHHREYTADEMRWMIAQTGCHRVRNRMFDYNLLQFDRLPRAHIEALMGLTTDPTLADTILTVGVAPSRRIANEGRVA
jgi:2-polyprenyl-3-methyl-5-hydroxy-6-metoxy-1,4-benzoquinol methylase